MTREDSLLQRYMQMREMSLHLCSPLSVEDHALQPMPDASPAKWHLAHTTWFFETFVLSQYMQDFRPYPSSLPHSFQFLLQHGWRPALENVAACAVAAQSG